MSAARRGRRIDWRRAPNLTTALVDIDLALTGVVSQHRGPEHEGVRRSYAGYALEGFTRLPAADAEEEADSHLVYLLGYGQGDRLDRGDEFDPRSVCYIATDRAAGHAWRTNIYIEGFVFRRMVELYATRRIDAARISILVKAVRGPSDAVEVPRFTQPMLRSQGAAHRHHSRGHLMSVQTSLNGGRAHPAILFQATGSTGRGRRFASSP